MTGLRRQLSLLGTAPGFRLLFLATLGSSLGTLLATIALVVDVKDRTNSGPWVSALMVVEFLPAVAVGIFFGPLLDRLSRRGVMIVSDLVRCAVFCTLPFAGSAGSIVALAGIAGLATGFFRPAVYAGLPNLVEEHELGQANSLIQTSENVSWTVAPVIGGALVAVASPDLAYWVNAASFLLSALLLLRIPRRSLQGAILVGRGHLQDLADGFARVVRTRPLLTVLVVWTIALGAIASANTAQVFLAKDTFSAGDFGYGLVFGCIGLGLAIGSFAAGSWVERRSVGNVYAASILLQAIGLGAAGAMPNVWAALPCFVLSGIGNGTAVVCNSLLVQRGASDEIRGRVFTVIMSVNYAVFGIGFAVAGPLTDSVGPRWVFAYELVRDLYPETGRTYAVGITGPPGVGKSSLISALIGPLREQERTIGVISVDPSSPFSQGALLGDRIRLSDHFLDPGVFIRSMGTRGHLGGLAETTLQALLVLDAAGKELVFLETVGAGQGEVEVIGIADTVVLVLMPGSGDSVQALKAGIMEIPDVIAIKRTCRSSGRRSRSTGRISSRTVGSRNGGGRTSRARSSRSPRAGRRHI